MAICKKCGAQTGDAAFCPRCGTPVEAAGGRAAASVRPFGPKTIVFLVIAAVFAVASVVGSLLLRRGLPGAGSPGAGTWNAVRVEMSGMTLDPKDVYGGAVTLELRADGTCTFQAEGMRDGSGDGTWTAKDSEITVTDTAWSETPLTAALDKDTLVFANIMDSGMDMTFARAGTDAEKKLLAETKENASDLDAMAGDSEEEASGAESEEMQGTDSAPPSDYVDACEEYNGDWYGICSIENATGDYAGMDAYYYYAVMRVAMNADNTGNVYMTISHDPVPNFALTGRFGTDNVLYLSGTGWNGTVDEGGFLSSFNGYYETYLHYSDASGSYDMDFHLVPWNTDWQETDNYPLEDGFPGDDLVTTVSDLLGQRTDGIPSAS